jgi:hypothetical protein
MGSEEDVLISLIVERAAETQGIVMSTWHAMAFGAMVAWSPSLLLLAYLLRDIQDMPGEDLD